MSALALGFCVLLAVLVLAAVVSQYRAISKTPFVNSPPYPRQEDDGNMRIRDITVADVYNGTNWKLADPLEMADDINMEDLHIEPSADMQDGDYVAYSGVLVSSDGGVSPIIMIHEYTDCGYGGDYLHRADGEWQQLGLSPDPTATQMTEYIANPLDGDPSFIGSVEHDDDYRQWNRNGFHKWRDGINRD